ncbi:ribonuclease inhibitor-like [Sardina pilchardus]|uniref:ribonuclease inhibitor-like n=1 Tax=Sardina pilchardus TaxID=27697 RepID=UPI002E1384C2
MSGCDLQTSEDKLLSGLRNPNCRLEKLRFVGCKLTDKSCEIVASVLQSSNSLMELDLSHNNLGDSGVQLLSKGLSSPHCKLQTLRLSKCGISDEGYVCLALTLMSNPSCVKDLDVSDNHPGESAQKLLSATLEDPHRKVEAIQLNQCHLSKASCEMMASMLQSAHSHLRELDMSDNDLQDEGVELLCVGLRDPQCKLETLRLSGCLITHEGCFLLSSALKSNPSYLKQLDLNYNHPGDSGVRELTDRLNDPSCKLETLSLETHVDSQLSTDPRCSWVMGLSRTLLEKVSVPRQRSHQSPVVSVERSALVALLQHMLEKEKEHVEEMEIVFACQISPGVECVRSYCRQCISSYWSQSDPSGDYSAERDPEHNPL